ncbi:MAG: pyridoxal phosphate-dependent aminotransferase [Nitriliruptoraceae bacterium]
MTVTQRIQDIGESPTMAVDARAKALKAQGAPIIGFGAGEPDFPTPANIVAAAANAITDPASHRYTPAAGLPELRAAIAARATADGHSVDASNVVVTAGGKHALFNTFMTLIEPGDEVLVPAPYWVSYPEQIQLCGGITVALPTTVADDFLVTVDQLEQARTPRTKALVFVSPSNPTGAVYSPEQTAQIGQWAATHNIWIITDEIYSRLVYGTATWASMPALVPDIAPMTVVVDGVSKTYSMTGWRLGWSIAPAEITQGMNTLQSHTTSNVANVSQLAALEALTGPQDAADEMRTAFDRRRKLAVEHLRAIDGVEVAEPKGAFYVFPSFEGHLGRTIAGRAITSSMDLAALLLDEANVAIVPGEAFGAPGYARLSYALGDDDLIEGVSRIRDLLTG